VADIANEGYVLQGGVFSLPNLNLIYTPQCQDAVKLARSEVVELDPIDEEAITHIEEALQGERFCPRVRSLTYLALSIPPNCSLPLFLQHHHLTGQIPRRTHPPHLRSR